MTHQAPNPGDPNYDWSDPHGFHHDAEGHETHGHHTSPWQLLVGILGALLFFTALTVWVAKGEVWLTETTDFPITQLWNVLIAMSIATIKAMLVMMYFMHLRHDNPLNTWIMLFTFLTFAVFLTFPALDIANRDAVNPFKQQVAVAGGTGVAQKHYGPEGDTWTGISKVDWLREKQIEKDIEKYGADEGEWQYWKHFYDEESHYHHHVHRYVREDLPADSILWDSKNYFARWEAEGGGHHGDDHGGGHGDDHTDDHSDDHSDDHAADEHAEESHAEGGDHGSGDDH
ncbi:MAG: cytochrome C oxidase subunit IV family protein [Planctomycetota bacterium]